MRRLEISPWAWQNMPISNRKRWGPQAGGTFLLLWLEGEAKNLGVVDVNIAGFAGYVGALTGGKEGGE